MMNFNNIGTLPKVWTKIIRELIKAEAAKDRTALGKAKIPAAYVSGNPTQQLPGETASTLGTKTQKVARPHGFGLSAPVASEDSVFGRDSAGRRVDMGALMDLSSAAGSGDVIAWGSVKWAQPGSGATLDSANTERNTVSGTYGTVKKFIVDRPGRFRLTFGLASSGSGTNASAKLIATFNGTSIAVSGDPGATSNSIYPTFNGKTVDMNQTVWPGWIIEVQLKETSGAGTAYINNCVILYSDATAAQASYHAVLQD